MKRVISHPRPSMAALLLASFILFSGHVSAAYIYGFNTDFKNTTGNVVNDYHVRLSAGQPITGISTYKTGGDVVFGSTNVQGEGTNSVTVDWSGSTVNQGQTTHVGVWSDVKISDIVISESWWTVGGVKVQANGYDGLQASADFDGGTGYTVAMVELFDDLVGTNLIATQWIEGYGSFLDITNEQGGSIYARSATLQSTSIIAIADLNHSLGGFSGFTPITQINATPTPAPLALLFLGGLGLVVCRKPA